MHVNRLAVRPVLSFSSALSPAWRKGLAAVSAATVLLLAGCESVPLKQPPSNLPTVGRVTLGLPAGDWVHVAHGSEVLQAAGEGQPVVPLKSRAVALRGSHGEVQAVVLVLANVTNNPLQVTQWGQSCPAGDDLRVEDRAKDSPERVDCLRSKTRALVGGWLDKREPAVTQWLQANSVPMPREATWVSHQFGNRAGMYVAVHVFADRRLLEPKTHDNDSFLAAGVPLLQWSKALAEAVRVSTGMVDGRLDIPPFPLPQPVDPAPQAVVLEKAPPPAVAAPAADAASAPAAQLPPTEPVPEAAPPMPERVQRADRE